MVSICGCESGPPEEMSSVVTLARPLYAGDFSCLRFLAFFFFFFSFVLSFIHSSFLASLVLAGDPREREGGGGGGGRGEG